MSRKHHIPPIEKFPLHPRRDGRWQKWIRGQMHYYTGATRAEAKAKYDLVKDDLYAGRSPHLPTAHSNQMTLKQIANLCLAEKRADRDAKGMQPDTYDEYETAIGRFLAFKSPSNPIRFARRIWHTMRPEDFADYGRYLASKSGRSGRGLGPHAYNRERTRIFTMFRMASEFGWITHPLEIGRRFKRRSASESRGMRKNWLLTPATIRSIYASAGLQLRAMILLGLNGGFGPSDNCKLPWTAVDFRAARVRFRRTKNNIDRDMPMWPELVAVLKSVRAQRPDDSLVFRTRHGNPWTANSIAHEFSKIKRLPLGVGLNACRHTFATYAIEVEGIGPAYKRIMGRKVVQGIDETYIDAIFLPKLKRITNHVYRRLQIRKTIGNLPRRSKRAR